MLVVRVSEVLVLVVADREDVVLLVRVPVDDDVGGQPSKELWQHHSFFSSDQASSHM